MWPYCDDTCQKCGTRFRIGEVEEKCALCQQPFLSHPYYDVGERNHHWCKKNNQQYCTSCFMQLFFDGYIDLSSDKVDIDNENFIGFEICTEIGTVVPYQSRLAAKGYEFVDNVQEWNRAKQVSIRVVADNHKYLMFGIDAGLVDTHRFLIYRNISKLRQ